MTWTLQFITKTSVLDDITKMTLTGFEAISSDHQILTRIYQYLHLEDQLRLSRVNRRLSHIFESYIWTENYSSLTVICHELFHVVVTNESGVNRLRLKPQEFSEFLLAYSDRVMELSIINCYLEMEIYQHIRVSDQLDIRLFPNLQKLYMKGMIVTTDDLELIVQMCLHLNELRLEGCVTDEGSILQINKDFDSHILRRIKKLKALQLEHESWFHEITIKYHKWQELVQNLKLESLKLDALIEPEPVTSHQTISPTQLTLKDLTVKVSFDEQKWGTGFPLFLENFQLLTSLTIELIDDITDKVLRILAQTCENLQLLKFTKSSFACPQILLPSTLMELALSECKGLTWPNLEQILTMFHIQKFSSISVLYQGIFRNPIQISSSIQTLELDCEHITKYHMLLASNKNETLKRLIWHHPEYCRTKVNSPYMCPRLPDPNQAQREDPLSLLEHRHLKSLLQLTIPHPMSLLNWSHIMELLNHPSLKQFTILNGCGIINPQSFYSIPNADSCTGITSLSIPLDIFEMALDFWLNLFACNEKLISFYCTFTLCDNYDGFLKKLIAHKNFPSNLRTIDVFGYTVGKCENSL